ncbi:hypothetical protein M0R19_03515 [Candidatus Pacearchaeota archaeon]|nr:hypothetical protein [Candidatus Pacearchaeota archaeon]
MKTGIFQIKFRIEYKENNKAVIFINDEKTEINNVSALVFCDGDTFITLVETQKIYIDLDNKDQLNQFQFSAMLDTLQSIMLFIKRYRK